MTAIQIGQKIGEKIKEINEIMMFTENHDSLIYWRGVIAGLEYIKAEVEKDEQGH